MVRFDDEFTRPGYIGMVRDSEMPLSGGGSASVTPTMTPASPSETGAGATTAGAATAPTSGQPLASDILDGVKASWRQALPWVIVIAALWFFAPSIRKAISK